MTREIRGRTVLSTAASSGIGRATALAVAAEGGRPVPVARRTDRLEQVARAIESRGGAALACPAHVTVRAQVELAVEQAVRRFGRLAAVVNNAGAGLFASAEDTTDDDLARILDLNFKGTLYGIQAALPVMRRQGAGHIINVASTAGRRGSPYAGAYCASRFAVVGLTESLRVELRGSGIDVTLVCPGAMRTEFFDVARRRTPRHMGSWARSTRRSRSPRASSASFAVRGPRSWRSRSGASPCSREHPRSRPGGPPRGLADRPQAQRLTRARSAPARHARAQSGMPHWFANVRSTRVERLSSTTLHDFSAR